MQLFYFSSYEREGVAILDEEEAGHCVRTLRKQIGDKLELTDGRGGLWQGTLLATEKRRALVQLLAPLPPTAPVPAYPLHLAVAPTKNIERIEWLLEKAVEMGLSAFTPLLCARSERRQLRVDRLEKIALAAMKQSLHLHLPTIAELTPMQQFLQQLPAASLAYIAHCHEGTQRSFLPNLLEFLPSHNPLQQPIYVLIGAEGDFTADEVNAAQAAGCRAVTLGNTRLRTETAALAAACMVAQHNFTLASAAPKP